MKRTWILIIALGLLFLYVGVINPQAEKRRRAELHMLDVLRDGVSKHLWAGGGVPTNWFSLSNVVKWELVAGICEYNQLPPPMKSYAVLPCPVFYRDYQHTGSIFLVRSKPRKWETGAPGRWVLVGSSNRVSRIWLPEKNLMPAIRSQLKNQTAN